MVQKKIYGEREGACKYHKYEQLVNQDKGYKSIHITAPPQPFYMVFISLKQISLSQSSTSIFEKAISAIEVQYS